MSTRLRNRNQLVKNLQGKAYRDAFVEAHIRNGIAFQIRALRESKPWKQKELADRIETQQEAISRLENPDYGRYTLETLRKLASVFDVALMVRFTPFSELIDRVNNLSPSDIAVADFAHDKGLIDWHGIANNVHNIFPQTTQAASNAEISVSADANKADAASVLYG